MQGVPVPLGAAPDGVPLRQVRLPGRVSAGGPAVLPGRQRRPGGQGGSRRLCRVRGAAPQGSH
eukprot:8003859-Heterocapsa_arctica.AAC.2